jgi:Ala-tRNA(Pro) deacylase
LTETKSTYEELIALLDREGASYRLLDHPAEGRTELVSAMRGHATRDAAKCMIVMLKIGKKITKFILAVIPGDTRVDLEAIRRHRGGTFVRFAEPGVAETLSNCVAGTILPFAFNERLELVVDPDLTVSSTIYFNAGRLDRSVALVTADYLRIAKPRIERIAVKA